VTICALVRVAFFSSSVRLEIAQALCFECWPVGKLRFFEPSSVSPQLHNFVSRAVTVIPTIPPKSNFSVATFRRHRPLAQRVS